METWIIVNWWVDCDPDSAVVAVNENGKVMTWNSKEEAIQYGSTLNGGFKAVRIS